MRAARIRLIKTHDEFRQCEQLQRKVWGSLSVSSEVMIVTQKFGGAVLGAFWGGKLVGFLYAFLARRRQEIIHWSHMMAVSPGYRDQGLGFRMKLAHRKLALRRGIKSICWTFDPLESRNATLNIAHLGARPEEYIRDCYGRFPSTIEMGLPSDRFVVHWPIGSADVRRRLRQGFPGEGPATHTLVNETETNSRGFLENQRLRLNLHDKRLAVEIPPNTDEIRAKNISLARKWRLETRRIFEKYLATEYRVEDFVPPGKSAARRCYYILERAL